MLLERAAWQLQRGGSATDVAWDSGFESLEGFSRAFSRAHGQPPSRASDLDGFRVEAPNGIHYHPPAALWLTADSEESTVDVAVLLVEHDLDDTTDLLRRAAAIDPDHLVDCALGPSPVTTAGLPFGDQERSVLSLLRTQVHTKEIWLAAIRGDEFPTRVPSGLDEITARHQEVAPRWRAWVREVAAAQGWGESIVDALCEPPERFSQGGILAHVVTHGAHRRALVRELLAPHESTPDAATPADRGPGDPLDWENSR